MSKGTTEGGRGSRLSSRVEPFWLNPATIKGTIAILGGVAILLVPEVSAFVLRVVVGGALIVSGATDLWFKVRIAGAAKLRVIAEGVVTILAGVALLVYPSETLRIVALIAGIYLVARGFAAVTFAFRQRAADEGWLLDAARGLFLVAFGAIVIILPEGVIDGLSAFAAIAAVVLGGIMLSYGVRAHTDEELVDVDAATVSQLIVDWLDTRDVGDERREEIGDGLFFEEPARFNKLLAWWVMLLLSVAIATFGILQDSTAVVIGAMLIAPLMTPILGTAAAIVNAWNKRIVESLGLVVVGVAASVALAFVIGQWVPALSPLASNSQVTSRVSPNMIDMLIALAAGAAGAYANVDKRVSDSIAGVAIAVALVPPLGVVGLTLQATLFNDALGAFLLFLTNLVSIILAATLVFFLTGYAPFEELVKNRREVGALLKTVAVAALVILIPLVFTAQGVLSTAGRQSSAQDAVADWLGPDTTFTVLRVVVSGDTVKVFLAGPGELPSAEDLEEQVSAAFEAPAEVEIEWAPTVVVTYSDEDGLSEQTPIDDLGDRSGG